MNELTGKKIAILVADGFEQVELTSPRDALHAAGAVTEIVSLKDSPVQGMNHDTEKGEQVEVDEVVDAVSAADYDGLLLPGGVANPDKLRVHQGAMRFVRDFFEANKPVAAICHAPWSLVETGVVRGRQLTSWPSLQTDIRNAGGEWRDEEVVVSGNLVTSRKPDDLPAFNKAIVALYAGQPVAG